VFASSAYVHISSVNVQDATGKISVAGIATGDWTTALYSSVTVGGVNASGFMLTGTKTTVAYSSAAANSSGAATGVAVRRQLQHDTQSYVSNRRLRRVFRESREQQYD